MGVYIQRLVITLIITLSAHLGAETLIEAPRFFIRLGVEYPALNRPLERPWRQLFDRHYPAKRCEDGSHYSFVVNLDLGSGVGIEQESLCVQALVPKATVERLYESIVSGFAWPAEVQRYGVLVDPAAGRFRCQLRSIVHTNDFRRAADRRDPPHRFDHLLALDLLFDG